MGPRGLAGTPGLRPGGFFLRGDRVNRTAFLVDGFNLYHSLRAASEDLGGVGTKWLDLRSLCSSHLSNVGGGAQLETVIYFSALATYKEAWDPNVTVRHRAYIECLRSTGVEVELGHFKEKLVKCPKCGRNVKRHEEKETDVAIGVELLQLFWTDRCDSAVLVSGDSDLAPAIRSAQGSFPKKRILSVFPYRRISFELKTLVSKSVRIKAKQYLRHQFPNTVRLANGRTISKPPSW